METAFRCEWASARSFLPSFITRIFWMVVLFALLGSYVAAVAVVGTVPITYAFNQGAFEENSGWSSFRGVLPCSRRQLVRAHFLMLVLLAVGSLGVALAVVAVAIAAAPALGGVFPWLGADAASWDPMAVFCEQALSSVLLVGTYLVFVAVLEPLLIRFGITRTTTALPVVAILVIVLLFIAFQSGDLAGFGAALDGLATRFPWALTAGSMAVGLLAMGVGCTVAERLFSTKEL